MHEHGLQDPNPPGGRLRDQLPLGTMALAACGAVLVMVIAGILASRGDDPPDAQYPAVVSPVRPVNR